MRVTVAPARPAILALALSVSGTAVADSVTLRNGDRLTGTIVRKENGTLILKTSYAGEVKIKWGEVAALRTDQPVEIQLSDGSHFRARLAGGGEGAAAVEPAAAGRAPNVPFATIAFINPTPEQSGRGVTYKRRVNLAANLVRGNTDSGRVYAEGEFVARAKSYRYRFWGQGTRASEDSNTTESNWRATASYDWFVRQKEFVYGRMSFEQDKFRDLKLRAQVGGGLGYQFLETKDIELSAQLGPDFVRAMSYGEPDESFVAASFGLHYSQWLWSRAAQIYFDQTGFWNLQTTSDVVIHANTGVRVPLAGGLQATTQVKVDWDNDPAPGTESTDTTLLLGLGYEW
jgi:putative salt-induced outer membrane protein YdiY